MPGQWHRVENRFVLNTPGEKDGLIEGWFDGELALQKSGIRFRDVESLSIDVFMMSTFFGGSSSAWAPTKDEFIYFDDFSIYWSRRRLGF